MRITGTVSFPLAGLTASAQAAIEKAKPKLKQQITKDCNANVPMRDGFLIDSALRWAAMTNDYIKWDTPYAHFQYIGKVMIGEITRSPWARRGEKKIYTDRNLTYTRGGSHWIEKTKNECMQDWKRLLATWITQEMKK